MAQTACGTAEGENMSKPRMLGMIKKPMNLKDNKGKKRPFETKKGNETWKKSK